MTSDRDALRRELRARRRSLTAPQRIAAAEGLAARLLSLPFAPSSGYVAGYWASDGEIALHAWQTRLPKGCIYCLPVLQPGMLRFAPWRFGDPLVTNRYGIPEPDVEPGSLIEAAELSLIVMPLVGFDRDCHRLGMGGGWYDRTLAFRLESPAPPWLVGAAFDEQQAEALGRAAWDVSPDAVCTPSRTYERPASA